MYYFYDIISGVLSCVSRQNVATFKAANEFSFRITREKYLTLQAQVSLVEEAFSEPT